MRRILLALFTCIGLVAGTLGMSVAPLAAAGPIPVDLSVEVKPSPAEVSPPGGIVVYEIIVRTSFADLTGTNFTTLPVDLTDSSLRGSYVASSSRLPSGCTAPADGTADPVITCDLNVAPGGSQAVWVALRTQPVVGTVQTKAEVSFDPSALSTVAESNPANNTRTEVTPVINNPNQSSALLHEGESMQFKDHVVTVLKSKNGVIVTLRDAPATGAACGSTMCDDGLHIGFAHNDHYEGEVRVDTNFGKGEPCRAISNPSCGDGLYIRKTVSMTPTKLLPCSTAPQPCHESSYKLNGDLHRVVLMESEDPDLLPPGSLPNIAG